MGGDRAAAGRLPPPPPPTPPHNPTHNAGGVRQPWTQGTAFHAWSEQEIKAFLDQRGGDYDDCPTFEALVSLPGLGWACDSTRSRARQPLVRAASPAVIMGLSTSRAYYPWRCCHRRWSVPQRRRSTQGPLPGLRWRGLQRMPRQQPRRR